MEIDPSNNKYPCYLIIIYIILFKYNSIVLMTNVLYVVNVYIIFIYKTQSTRLHKDIFAELQCSK